MSEQVTNTVVDPATQAEYERKLAAYQVELNTYTKMNEMRDAAKPSQFSQMWDSPMMMNIKVGLFIIAILALIYYGCKNDWIIIKDIPIICSLVKILDKIFSVLGTIFGFIGKIIPT